MSNDQNETQYNGLTQRIDLTRFMRPGGIGIELGVAEGKFSALILARSELSFLYSVDMYGGGAHDINEYRRALRNLMPHRHRSALLRMRFDEALELFPDASFDFVFVDGFAHTGEEDGRTIEDWYPKVAPGGIFAGHDYDQRWPRVIAAVDAFFARRPELQLHTINFDGATLDPNDYYNMYGTWFTLKPANPA